MAVSLSWTITVTNTSDTAATVKVVLKAKSTNGSYNLTGPSGWIKIDGTKYSFSHNFSKNTTTTLATKSKSVARTTSSKSVSISASFSTGVSSGTITKSGSTTVSARPVYTVYFYNGYGGTYSTAAVYSGYTTTFPYISRAGYTFGSWSGYAQGASTPAISGNTSYTASWTPITYSIGYSLDGGSISGQPTSYTITSSEITLPKPIRTGYHFIGWTGSNGTTPEETTKIPTGSTGNKSYTANWELNKYHIILNLGDGTGQAIIDTTPIDKDHNVSVLLPEPYWRGHIFAGWTDPNGNNIGNNCPPSLNGMKHGDDIELVAAWNNSMRPVILHYYSSIHDINSTYQIYKIIDEPINNLPNTLIENHIFKGWYSDNGTFQNKVTNIPNAGYDYAEGSAQYDNPEPIHLYAKWNKIYTIKFNNNTPSYNDNIEVDGMISSLVVEDGKATTLNFKTFFIVSNPTGNPSIRGYYIFNEQSETYELTNHTTVHQDVTYYVQDYLRYVGGEENNVEDKCLFKGWSTSPSGEAIYTDNNELNNSKITLTELQAGQVYNLYAVWEPQTFIQSFGAEGLEDTYTISATYYETIQLPNESTVSQYGIEQQDYYISGWILNGKVYSIGDNFLVTKSNDFLVKWVESYVVPALNVVINRYSDETALTQSSDGRFIKIELTGTNGSYIVQQSPVEANYSYDIKATFYDEFGGEISTTAKSYTSDTNQVFGSKIIKDKGLHYSSCKITFIDTSVYEGHTVDEEIRTVNYTIAIPLKRRIAMHIADDNSAISLFDELAEGDKGLVIHGPISIVDNDRNISIDLGHLIQIIRW